MSVDIKLPDLGDGVESGDVLDILVKEGDQVAKHQGILELETDKATVEVPATQAGRITKIHVARGDTVKAGAILLTLEPAATEAKSPPPAATPSEPMKLSASEEPPSAATPPAVAQPAKTPTQATPSKRQPAPEPEPQDLVPAKAARALESSAPARRMGGRHNGPIPAGPAIRRFAREVGVDLADVSGSGTGGRVTREDILEVVRRANRAVKDAGTSAADQNLPGAPAHDEYGPIRVETASKIRRTIAARMHQSWETIPRVTNFDDADVTELEKIRQASKEDYAANDIKLTTMPFIIKAVSMALRKHPLINATYDAENGEIIYKRYVSIGMAVDSDRGLVVPVLRNTDQLSISEIARLVASTADRVRRNEFGLEDLRGGSFTISNLGAVGGTYSTPIINLPEVAILLTGRSRQMPVVFKGQVTVRLMMPLSLSYDHRIIDGATAARFLNEVMSYLQAPSRLLLAP